MQMNHLDAGGVVMMEVVTAYRRRWPRRGLENHRRRRLGVLVGNSDVLAGDHREEQLPVSVPLSPGHPALPP
jgi:hypothetical protein